MNPLAIELNNILEGTTASDLLSKLGKRFFFPKGIVAQSSEAAEHAHRFNATVGMARYKGKPVNLPSIRNYIPGLDPDEIFPYATTAGVKELRELWKKNMINKNPHLAGIPTSLPLVVAGITTGISVLSDLFIDPDDFIIIPDMFWGNYRLIIEGKKEGKIIPFSFFNEKGKLNIKALQQVINNNRDKGKLILLLNFPNNPTGYSPVSDEIEPVINAIKNAADSGLKILVIVDDSYFGLFYEDTIYPESIFPLLSNLHPNILSIKLDGATKEDFVWGFRVGFLTYGGNNLNTEQYQALEKKTMGVIRSTISNCNKLGQSLLIRALKSETYDKEKADNFKILKSKYEKVRRILSNIDKNIPLIPLPFNSGYFMCFKSEGISTEKLRQYLLYEKGIGTISIEDRFLRIAYACVELEDIEDLYREIIDAVKRIG